MGFGDRSTKWRAYKTGLLISSILIMIIAVTIGTANISVKEVVQIILKSIPYADTLIEQTWQLSREIIVLQVRLPRIVLGFLIGAGLAGAGAAFQAVFKNPMADPYIIGVSSGAALGATLAISLRLSFSFLGFSSIPLLAFIGALSTIFLVYNLARTGRKVPVQSLLLAGIAVSFFFSALVSLIIVLSNKQMSEIVFWLMGGLYARGWDHVRMAFPYITIGLVVIGYSCRELNVLLLGEEAAHHLGIDVERAKVRLLAAGSLVAAGAVSVSGIIGFVGLIIPHIVRLIVGPDHRILIPSSILIGGMFLVIADTIGRTIISPTEIPVGIITAIFGGPFFLYLLRRRKAGV